MSKPTTAVLQAHLGWSFLWLAHVLVTPKTASGLEGLISPITTQQLLVLLS